MPISLVQTEVALGACRDHLQATNAFGTPIEAYLTRHLVVLLCAEVESSVRQLIHGKVGNESSAPIAALVGQIGGNIVRNARHSEIKKVLGYLGPAYAAHYDELVQSSIGDDGIARLGNAVVSRNNVAHQSQPTVTFAEIESAHAAAEEVIRAVREAIDDG